MSGQPSYLKSVFEYYSNLSNDAVELVGKLAYPSSDPASKPEALRGEVLSLWTRGLLGPWAPLLIGGPWSLPKLGVKIPVGQTSADVAFVWPGDTSIGLDWTALDLVGNAAGNGIAKNKVKVSFVDGSSSLRIELSNLSANLPIHSRYEGIVWNTATAETIAMIVARVVPVAP